MGDSDDSYIIKKSLFLAPIVIHRTTVWRYLSNRFFEFDKSPIMLPNGLTMLEIGMVEFVFIPHIVSWGNTKDSGMPPMDPEHASSNTCGVSNLHECARVPHLGI